MSRLVKPTPKSDEEQIRSMVQRIRQLETKQTLRIGEWVMHSTEDGRLLATKPGEVNDVGSPIATEVDLGALRGYVTKGDVASAITQGLSRDLNNVPGTVAGMDTATSNAQYAADSANAAAARVEALLGAGDTGYAFVDTFDREAADDLGIDYFTTSTPGVGGTYGTDGEGNAKTRSTAGAFAKDWTFRHVTPTTTDNQTITAVLETRPRDNGGGNPAASELRLCARCSADNATRVETIVTAGTAYLGWRDAGTWNQFPGKSVGVKQSPGDRWDLLAGTGIGARHFVLLRNGLEVLSYNDLGGLTPMGVDHRFGALGVRAGTTIQHFVIILQVNAPTTQQFIVADRFL